MPEMLNNLKREDGHTLLEGLVAISIICGISILSALFLSKTQKETHSKEIENVGQIKQAFFTRNDQEANNYFKRKSGIVFEIINNPENNGCKVLSIITEKDTISFEFYERNAENTK